MIECDIATLKSADTLIRLALAEDLRDSGDVTSQATVSTDACADVNVCVRDSGRLSGMILIERVYAQLQQYLSPDMPRVAVAVHLDDGNAVEAGQVVATVSGPVQALLTGERVALNFLIHLSGIATATAEFVRRVEGSNAVILDTRKTLPGYRLLQKYAVRCGGGTNHRMGLYDGMLIKDNHLAAGTHQSLVETVTNARTYLSRRSLQLPVEVEVDTLTQLREVLTSRPEIVLLDNMKSAQLQQAVAIRNEVSPDTLLEASGGITLESVGCVAGTGVDRISVGSLTHSSPALDLGYDWAGAAAK